MNTPQVDVHIEYLSEPDDETPFIRVRVMPRTGEFIQLASGKKYEIKKVIHIDGEREMVMPWIVVDFIGLGE